MSEHHRTLERMYGAAPINRFYAPAMRVGDAEATVEIDVREDFFHAGGAVHGSVYFKMLDDAAFFAVQSIVEDAFVLTTSFQTYLTRPVTTGRMTSRGRVLNRSRRLYIAEAVLTDGDGREVGRGSGGFMPSRIALDPSVGYT